LRCFGCAKCQIGFITVKQNGIIAIRIITGKAINKFVLDAFGGRIMSVEIFEAMTDIDYVVKRGFGL